MKILGKELGSRLSHRDQRMAVADFEVQKRIESAFGFPNRPYSNTELWAMVIGNNAGRYKYPALTEQDLIDECLTIEDLGTLLKRMVELSPLGHVSVAQVVHNTKFCIQPKYLNYFRHLSFNYENILKSSSPDKIDDLKLRVLEDLSGRDKIGARISHRSLSSPNGLGRIEAWRVLGTYANEAIEWQQIKFRQEAASILDDDEAILVARPENDKPQIVRVNNIQLQTT